MLIAADPSLDPVGYSVWRVLTHLPDGRLGAFLRFDPDRRGAGATLMRIDPRTGQIESEPIPGAIGTCEQWYWSASAPTLLYAPDADQLRRYDTATKEWSVVFGRSDWEPYVGPGKYLWQFSSSADELAHACTIRDAETERKLGTFVYALTGEPMYFPARGILDESQISKSGRWLLIIETNDGSEDNRVIDRWLGTERIIVDRDHAAGHHDMGYGLMIAHSNYDNAWAVWDLEHLTRRIFYRIPSWDIFEPSHVSWCNAPMQFCVGYTSGGDEAMVMPLSGAPVTRFSTPGIVHGNVDALGQWFVYTNRDHEAHLVRLPTAERRVGARDRRTSTSTGSGHGDRDQRPRSRT